MISFIAPGKVFIDYGPISMVISAWHQDTPLTDKCFDSCQEVMKSLKEITSCLPELRKAWPLCKKETLNEPALLMWQNVKETDDKDLTSMAAVAGLISDLAADWLVENGATKVIVNNGGDIAMRLLEDEVVNVGILPHIQSNQISCTLRIKGSEKIGGIATSGIGGRSFTQGVMDCVTVFAERCVRADAFATSIANSSYITSERVKQTMAKLLDPNTDIPELFITTEVGDLLPKEKERSLSQLRERVETSLNKQKIKGVIGYLQGEIFMMPENFFKDK